MSNKKSVLKRYNRAGYVFVLPWVLGFLVLMLFPLIQTIRFSFSELSVGANGNEL